MDTEADSYFLIKKGQITGGYLPFNIVSRFIISVIYTEDISYIFHIFDIIFLIEVVYREGVNCR